MVYGPAPRGAPVKIVVRNVPPNSPAGAAGLQVGDGIVEIEGKPARGPGYLAGVLDSRKPGDTLTLGIMRQGGERKTVTITVAAFDIRALCDQAVELGAAFVAKRQQEDGGWLRKGLSKEKHGSEAPWTAVCARALAGLPKAQKALYAPNITKGIDFLLSRQAEAGQVVGDPGRQHYATYTTALTLSAMVLAGREKEEGAKKLQAWLLETQIDQSEDITEYDFARYGAWNIYDGNETGATLAADLSVSTCAIEALARAGLAKDSPTRSKALVFLRRTQNLPDSTSSIPAQFLDGGFVTNPRESKAGRQLLPDDNIVFRPYGSTTADGLRSLLHLGVDKEDERVQAAVGWLTTFFHTSKNPNFPAARRGSNPTMLPERGIYFYYLNGMSEALALFGEPLLLKTDGTEIDWAAQIARRLISVQKPDGTWRSESSTMHENDPNLATSLAIMTLARIRPFLEDR
jgi:hypothetical protein